MRTQLALLLLAIQSAAGIHAQEPPAPDLTGTWKGSIQILNKRLPIEFEFSKDFRGEWRGLAKFADVVDKKVSDIHLEGEFVSFNLKMDEEVTLWQGRVSGRTILGMFTEDETEWTFQISRLRSDQPEDPEDEEELPPLSERDLGLLQGTWVGSMRMLGEDVPMTLRIETENGLEAWIRTTQMEDHKLSRIVFINPQLRFEAQAAIGGASWEGRLRRDTIKGRFAFDQIEGEFQLRRSRGLREEEMRVATTDGNSLDCTLTLPVNPGSYPAALLLSGMGPQDRDEEILGFRPFLLLAQHLARQGIASLRCDDRGVGGSTGDILETTSADLAQDALAALRRMSRHEEVDAKRTGFIGHDEGGLVAAMAAAQAQESAFVVLLAPPGLEGERVLTDLAKAGLPSEDAEALRAAQELQQSIHRAVRSGEGWDEVEKRLRREAEGNLASMPEQQRGLIGDPQAHIETAVAARMRFSRSRWLQDFISIQPSRTLTQVRCPVLAVFAELDRQIPAQPNRAAIEGALKTAAHPDFEIRVVPRANHLFQEAVSGKPQEYASLEKEFVSGFLEAVSQWILSRTDR